MLPHFIAICTYALAVIFMTASVLRAERVEVPKIGFGFSLENITSQRQGGSKLEVHVKWVYPPDSKCLSASREVDRCIEYNQRGGVEEVVLNIAEGNDTSNQNLEWELVNRKICTAIWEGNFSAAQPLESVSTLLVIRGFAKANNEVLNRGAVGTHRSSCTIGRAEAITPIPTTYMPIQ